MLTPTTSEEMVTQGTHTDVHNEFVHQCNHRDKLKWSSHVPYSIANKRVNAIGLMVHVLAHIFLKFFVAQNLFTRIHTSTQDVSACRYGQTQAYMIDNGV